MRTPKQDLPLVEDYGEGFRGHQIEWGGMIVSYDTFPKGVDARPIFQGLPNGMCQSHHWGYVLKGRVRVKRSDGRDEVLQTGDVYYLEPGHVPLIEEDSEILEFSPKTEYQATLDVVARNMAAIQGRR
jgi:AraC-like ligand binding domain